MKKIISALTIALVIFPFGCSAQSINIGTFGTSSYFLIPESLRICSTSSCLYIFGQEQEYVAAKIQVVRASDVRQKSEDVLAYNDTTGYTEQTVLFKRDGTSFVLVTTTTYDINGNFKDTKDMTIEKKRYQSNTATVTKDANNNTEESRQIFDIYVRNVRWSTVFPGSPGEAITRAVLSYADANFSQIEARSSQENFIKAQ